MLPTCCTFVTVMENGDRLCDDDNPCVQHNCSRSVCNC